MNAPSKKRYEGVERRIRVVGGFVLAALLVLCGRLWQLQVIEWDKYHDLAEYNRLHPQRLKAPRGLIYGQDTSMVLADNKPSCDLVIIPAECGAANLQAVCARLGDLLGIDAAALLARIEEENKKQGKKAITYRQVLVKQDVTKTDLTRVRQEAYQLPGIFAVARPQRHYNKGKVAGQILGYLGGITEEELKQYGELYEGDDMVGRSGLEQKYESDLRGTDGMIEVQVYVQDRRPQLRVDEYGKPILGRDSYGHELTEEYREDPEPGQAIFTTLDIGLQEHCEKLLEGQVGTVVVLNAETGAVLTMASTPLFDPSIFVTYGRNSERAEALMSKPNPIRNRAYQEAYAPGSIFKVLLATAVLEEGRLDKDTCFECRGAFQLSNHTWRCWQKTHGHGAISMIDALAYSCDVYFYNVGLRLGVDKINEWAEKFSIGQRTGIDLPREVAGLIPGKAWRKKTSNRRWYPGDTVNLSIGQGEAHITPLQCCVLMAAVVNGGRRVTPHVNANATAPVSDPLIGPKTLEIVRAGMLKCVERDRPAPTGTGKAAKIPGVHILGKTGTAEVSQKKHDSKKETLESIPYEEREHAWFIAGVLDREPKIAICVLIEHGGHGGDAAAPLAKSAIEKFYGLKEKERVTVAQETGG